MKTFLKIAVITFVFLFGVNLYAEIEEPVSVSVDGVEMADGEIIVCFYDNCTDERIVEILGEVGINYMKRKVRGNSLYLLPIPSGEDIKDIKKIAAQLASYDEVKYAEPNYSYTTNAVPNDTYYADSNMYGFPLTDAPDAWDTITDASGVVVAVMDTGVDYNHPDLSANIWSNTGEIAGDSTDNDGNGYIDDVRGWNFLQNNNAPLDADSGSHGTFCSGVIGAVGNNAKGITGVCWSVKIMPLKVATRRGEAYTFAVVEAIYYAVAKGAKLINFSYGGTTYSDTMYNGILYGLNNGVLFTIAAGNDTFNLDVTPVYPACYNLDNIISVGAIDSNDTLADFSNYSTTLVDLTAPGCDVMSTVRGLGALDGDDPNIYDVKDGTSFSGPFVAGACALVWAREPSLNYLGVKKKILNGADTVENLVGYISGGRRLNINNALFASSSDTPGEPSNPSDGVSHSTKVESMNGVQIIAERAMYWDTGDLHWGAGHANTGVTAPAQTWYLAEGCTDNDFEEWILIQNPSAETAAVLLTLMFEDGNTVAREYTVDGNTRYTVPVDSIADNTRVSAKVESTNGVEVIVERAMYKRSGGIDRCVGHCASGVTSTSDVWYVAEGSTIGSFDEYILIQNPSGHDIICEVTFMRSNGRPSVVKNYDVKHTSRYTIPVNIEFSGESVSAKVRSLDGTGIIVERAMYWDSASSGGSSVIEWAEGHSSCGVTSDAITWYLAEGSTSGFEEYVLVMNPNSTGAQIKLTVMRENSLPNIEVYSTVAAMARETYFMNDVVPDESISVRVESLNGVGIISERSMYWNSGEMVWKGGHNSAGVNSPASTWYFAEGCTLGTFSEWILIQNPNSSAAEVQITFMREDGVNIVKHISVPARSRETVEVNAVSGL